MLDTGMLTVKAFAKFARITRDMLHNYDKIGLLSPNIRGKNRYRYYSTKQLALVNVIRTLQKLGMTLAEIKSLQDRRTPELTDTLLTRQIEKIDKHIDEWICAKKLLLTLQNSIRTARDIDEKAIVVEHLPAEAIILGNLNDYSEGRHEYDALLNFYETMNAKYPDLDMNYPVWGIFSEERIKQGDWRWPDRYYFYNPEGHDKRPAGLYAIGYSRGGYGQNEQLYKRMLAYIDEHDLEICGNTYEEYPLNEVCISDDSNYLLRALIRVRGTKERQGGGKA